MTRGLALTSLPAGILHDLTPGRSVKFTFLERQSPSFSLSTYSLRSPCWGGHLALAGWLASGDPPMWGLAPSTQEKGGTTSLLRWGPNLD